MKKILLSSWSLGVLLSAPLMAETLAEIRVNINRKNCPEIQKIHTWIKTGKLNVFEIGPGCEDLKFYVDSASTSKEELQLKGLPSKMVWVDFVVNQQDCPSTHKLHLGVNPITLTNVYAGPGCDDFAFYAESNDQEKLQKHPSDSKAP
ncbi:MAG: hypothetical protein K2P93_05835 [Alphaproteobacteria bacterium]|nr:hypothetical protein [Alphaproteobacteria bacterium]